MTAIQGMRVVVVGGGAAGLMAAWRAAGRGHSVLLLEGNPWPAVKLRISGGGKCNVTHAGPMNSVLGAFPKDQARFLKPSFHAFGNAELIELLRSQGVETYARENGRVFPLDRPGSAALVVEALVVLARRAGVELRTGARVMALEGRAPRLEKVWMENGTRLAADAFILATGGASYPQTGTRGEMAEHLKQMGVPVNPWFPALAPIPLRRPHPQWEGVALRGGTLVLRAGQNGKRLAQEPGDVLFTRTSITGPAALELSGRAERARRGGAAWMAYAFTNESPEALDARLRDAQRENPHLSARHWLQRWIPERVAEGSLGGSLEGILGALPAAIPADQRMKDLSREHRRALVELVTAFPLGDPGAVNLARGEVSSGGVCLSAVDPRTMALKGWDNVRICGELLDIDGPVGGYNLQAAFSTGYVAGGME